MARSQVTEDLGASTSTASSNGTDEIAKQFLTPQFDPVDFLNSTLSTLSLSQPQAHQPSSTSTLSELSTQTQTLLSHLNASTSRISDTLTQITDEILRSGSRLAYEVEVLRGDTLGLSDTLTEGLRDDIRKFAPNFSQGEGEPQDWLQEREMEIRSGPRTSSKVTGGEAEDKEAAKAHDDPPYITQLRTLTLVKERLDTVIKVFGDAMAWTLPPSEMSLTSSFISVSAPEPGSESYSREEKGQAIAKELKKEITTLLMSKDKGLEALEAAISRVEELRNLTKVWKGTTEEKPRLKFVESLSKIVEERERALEKEEQEQKQASRARTTSSRKRTAAGGRNEEALDSENGRFGWPTKDASYGFINQLQKMRGGL
ncbi:MAG: hypothetical protein M1824_006356 [Vezdaea acicularis]|nr:MAG: hypothetical protein M1824_006356 [Vezdaea acicularis]